MNTILQEEKDQKKYHDTAFQIWIGHLIQERVLIVDDKVVKLQVHNETAYVPDCVAAAGNERISYKITEGISLWVCLFQIQIFV